MARIKIGNVYPTDAYLLARCAPTGHGLGESVCTIPSNGDANKIDSIGFYQCYINTPIDNENWYIIPLIHIKGTYAHQIAIRVTDGSRAERTMKNGIWGEWERVNPPLTPDIEYRTTERWNGKAVYVKMCDCGDLPNNTTGSVTLDIEKKTVVDINAIAIGAGSTYKLPSLNEPDAGNKIAFWNIGLSMFVKTYSAGWDGFKWYVTVKYTKD